MTTLLTVLNDLYKIFEVWQDGTAHEDRYLLYDLDTGVPCLPRLLAAADSLQKGKQRWNAKCRSNHGKCPIQVDSKT